jgi:hypothetical protein
MEKLGDRELTIIGAGAFLAVLCLLFKWPFAARVVVALLILIGTTIYALTRIGEDKYKIEEWLSYRFDKKIRPLKYTFKSDEQPGRKAAGDSVPAVPLHAPPRVNPVLEKPAPGAVMQVPLSPVDVPKPASGLATPARSPVQAAVTIAWEEIGIYRLVTIWLVVVGLYFMYWLYQGGTAEIGRMMKTLFSVP